MRRAARMSAAAAIFAALLCACGQSGSDQGRTEAAAEEGVPTSTSNALSELEQNLLPGVVYSDDENLRYTLADRMAHYNTPHVTMTLIRDGNIVAEKAYGDGAAPDMLFQAASLSKAVAAAGVATYAKDAGIDLDADITPLFKGFDIAAVNPGGQLISLRKLLSNTSGATVSGFPGYATDVYKPTTLEVLQGADGVNTEPVTFEPNPDGAFAYSGGGYTIAQAFIEEHSSRDFAELMDALILKPFQMTRSTFEQPLSERWRKENVARAHMGDGSPVNGGWHVYPELAAAGLWTTASDYARFAIAMTRAANGDADAGLDPSIAREAFKPTAQNTNLPFNYGLGLGVHQQDGRLSIRHGGRNHGYNCYFFVFTDTVDGLVVMTNGADGTALYREIMHGARALYGWPKDPRPEITPIALSDETLKSFAGRYVLEVNGAPTEASITLEIRDGGLFGYWQRELSINLTPISEEVFVDVTGGTQWRFDAEAGTATSGDGATFRKVAS
ncbi:MAG: serine hydrolase domain-containing protein [Pseudomonadota bacterium]